MSKINKVKSKLILGVVVIGLAVVVVWLANQPTVSIPGTVTSVDKLVKPEVIAPTPTGGEKLPDQPPGTGGGQPRGGEPPATTVANCAELYPGHNNVNANRINVVFEGVKYANVDDLVTVARNFIDLEAVTERPGLLGQEPFHSNSQLFNFWYLDNINHCDEGSVACGEVANQFYNTCQLPHKYYFRFFGSVSGPVWATNAGSGGWTWAFRPQIPGATDLSTRLYLVHEFGHSFTSQNLPSDYLALKDEYGGQAIYPNYGFLLRTGPWAGKILPNVYVSEDSKVTNQCLAQAPWRDLIGDGCGQAGVVDCIESYTPAEITPRSYERIRCRSGVSTADCYREVSCFEGALTVEKGAFRPTYRSIMHFAESDSLQYGYNLPSQRHLCRVIQAELGLVGGVCVGLLN